MYTLKKGNIIIEICENPLEIRSLKFKGKELCYQQDGAWGKNWPFLFPIVGLLKENKYTYENKEYEMKRHGFFRDITDFAVEDESEGLVTFSAKSNGKFQAIYPFEFEIKNQIEIINDEVVVSYEVTNLDTKQMIFTMGHHPAFLSKKDGVLTFDKTERFTKDVNNQGLVAEKPDYKFEIQETKIADLSFANSAFYFTQDLKSSWVRYEDSEIGYEISLDDYNTFLLWSASDEENFICIEPWLGIPDPAERENNDLHAKPRMLNIKPEESFTCELKIKFIK